MSQKTITTDPPRIDEDNFEDYLVTDEIFVDFFNSFLGLPSFPEPLRFNTETGGFEVLTSAKYEIADKIKAAVKARSTPRPQTAAVRFHAMDKEEEEEIKTSFSVKCLDKEQGIQWIKEERLPSFLHSELYSEYRMAKLLSQVETSPGGMKLTIDPEYRKWYKPKEVPPPPVVVDETEEMIKKMHVTLGSTTTSQTKEWYAEAKQVEEESTKLVSSRRSNVTVTRGPWARPRSSSRPTSVDSNRTDLAGDSTMYLLGDSIENCEKKKTGKRSVRFEEATSSEAQPITPQAERNIQLPDISVTQPAKVDISVHSVSETSSAMFGKVARMEPEISDDDSDQGMGSECLSSIEEDIVGSSDITSKGPDDEAELELKNIGDYSSTCVALCLKNAIITLNPKTEDGELDNMKIFDDLVPKPKDFILGLRHSKRPLPISKLNEKTFAQAIVSQENRVLKESGSLSRSSQSYGRSTKTDTLSIGRSDDILDLLKLPRKPLEFNEETGDFESRTASSACSDSDGYDSIFSEQSEEQDHRHRKKSPRYDVMDYSGFKKFKEFVNGTMGENIMLLWMDIDKIRFSLNEAEIPQFVSKTRQRYLTVSSAHHISKELLKKWNLEHASFWSKRKLKKTQRIIVESLLLYWAPRFLIHLSTRPVRLFKSPGISNQQRLLNREKRPLSTQSYPSKKTAIIKPLRPKSCLPKLTEKKQTADSERPKKQYHQMGMYQKLGYHPKYQQPMYHALKFKPYKMETKKPKSLFPPTMEAIPPVSQSLQMSKDRPASAGPTTMGTLAIIERKARSKSAKIGSASLPMVHSKEIKLPQPKNRRPSNSSELSILSGSSVSTILGSEPMESMLQALYHDTRAGLFFTRFCEQSGNKEWSNAIHFWFDTQEFHALFYRDAVDAYIVQRKAQAIHSNYIVVGAPEQIGLTKQQRLKVTKSLEPAFDELFDNVEEFVLKVLIVPWNQMLAADQDRYRKVELIEQERIVRVAAKYVRVLQMKDNIHKNQNVTTEAAQGDERYEEDLRSKVPEEFRHFTFNDLIRNRIELEHFKKFLEENYAKTDLSCWLDIESFMRLPHPASEKRDEKAKDIKSKYLHKKYFFGTSSPATKEQQSRVVEMCGGWGVTLKERPPNELIIEAQKYVLNRLSNRWLPRFLATSQYAERQRPVSQMSDVAEDIILQKQKKRGEPWRIMDSKWQSSTRDLVEFRHALANPITASQFRRYVSLKGDFLENDVLFWLEVQKYKDFCHSHNEQSAIDSKVAAIIHCFLDSHIPPSIQIDVPAEIAERIIQKKKDLGPYIFREAQITVLRVLFPYWSLFCAYRKNLTDEKLTTSLERQRARRMERVKQDLNKQQNAQIAKEQAAAERELLEREANQDQDPLADILSDARSESTGSIAIVEQASPSNQIHWSYGKYVEALDRERNLLLMENELKGRTPAERLPKVDEDVSSDEERITDMSDASGSVSPSITSSSSKTNKRKAKKKVISNSISDQKSSNGHPKSSSHSKRGSIANGEKKLAKVMAENKG